MREQKNKILQAHVDNDRIGNQYLLVGENKEEVLNEAYRLCNNIVVKDDPGLENKFMTGNLADFIHVGPENNSISIDKVREIIKFISISPFEADSKVVLIEDADKLRTEAANALLKSLEEPKSYVYFVLTTGNKDSVLKTIVSRCQPIYLYENKEEVDIDKKALLEILDRAMGQDLIVMVESKEFFNQFQKNSEPLFKLLIEFYSDFYKYKLTERTYRVDEEYKKLFEKYFEVDKEKLIRTLSKIEEVSDNFKINVNFELSMEELLLYIMEEKYA
ncbi:MAG: DNA polymerase III subunit delta' C-terminal domain-containing protein [Finegoldia sp.]|nr:DNA polymerase III subunit delta' C-terminal domain-containing protein [Finegoldia sp.]